jgi:hypothetical protein
MISIDIMRVRENTLKTEAKPGVAKAKKAPNKIISAKRPNSLVW